eukprot:4745621-Pleurochrysis_carterae.AAC.2
MMRAGAARPRLVAAAASSRPSAAPSPITRTASPSSWDWTGRSSFSARLQVKVGKSEDESMIGVTTVASSHIFVPAAQMVVGANQHQRRTNKCILAP